MKAIYQKYTISNNLTVESVVSKLEDKGRWNVYLLKYVGIWNMERRTFDLRMSLVRNGSVILELYKSPLKCLVIQETKYETIDKVDAN